MKKEVNVGEIIHLKSGGPKLLIEFVVGKSEPMMGPINVEEILRTRNFLKDGDVAIKWRNKGKEKKDVLINESLLLLGEELIEKNDNEINIGSVVKSILEDDLMTVVWIVGETECPGGIFDYNEVLINNNYKKGDIVCKWFIKGELKHEVFPQNEIEKLYE